MHIRHRCWPLLACLALISSPSTGLAISAGDTPAVAVRIGEIPDLDACGGWGQITGDSLLAVHGAPDENATIIDSLAAGTGVHLCSLSEDKQWQGIVYPAEPDQDCGVTSAVDEEQDYTGPCHSGWVPVSGVELLAG